MNNAEVLIKFTGDTTSVDDATKKTESNFTELQKKGEIAFLGLTAAADAFAGSILKGCMTSAVWDMRQTRTCSAWGTGIMHK